MKENKIGSLKTKKREIRRDLENCKIFVLLNQLGEKTKRIKIKKLKLKIKIKMFLNYNILIFRMKNLFLLNRFRIKTNTNQSNNNINQSNNNINHKEQ